MKIIKIAGFVLLVLFGAFLFVYGGYDDSPGAQLLGVLVVIGSSVGIRKSWKPHRD